MSSPVRTAGLHHVTAVAGDPQRNADFYRAVLGLRLVKQTVNFDDPETHHLYYGDETGRPGTLLTFFPFRGAPAGRRGTGQAVRVALAVPAGSLGWWERHLRQTGARVSEVQSRLDDDVLVVADPDGLQLELVARGAQDDRPPFGGGPVPPEHAVRGLDAVTLAQTSLEPSVAMLTEELGFALAGEEGPRTRLVTGDGAGGTRVDLLHRPQDPRGLVAAGTVHHVAWRAPDAETQLEWRSGLVEHGHAVTPVLDRQYFRSIYFREPGGVLFEVATDPPGFDWDEPVDRLGTGLRLPPWLEPEREQIERGLPPLHLPPVGAAAAGASGGPAVPGAGGSPA